MDRLGYLSAAVRRHGDVVCISPKLRRYLVTGPEDVKHVLQDNHLNYRQLVPKKPLMGHRSLTMSSGDAWRQRRRLMQPLFHPQRIASLAPPLAAATAAMLERWRRPAAAGEPIDVAREMVHLSLEALIGALFGPDADRDLKRAINQAFGYFDARRRRGGLALPLFLPTPGNRRLRRALDEMRSFIDRLVAKRRRDGEDRGDLLSMLLRARDDKTGEILDDQDLRDELMMLLVMGHMTTATALTWAWYLLSIHPRVTRRVGEELAAVLGGRLPTEEDLPNLTYLRQVVQEVLRLYPSTWSFVRGAIGDDVIGGYQIPAGSVIVLSPYVTHRREDLWPNPEGFDPERFSAENSQGRHRYAYFPFGSGPRTCIAASFALMEMPLVIATVARTYRLDLMPEQRIEIQANITLQPRYGLRMTLHPQGG